MRRWSVVLAAASAALAASGAAAEPAAAGQQGGGDRRQAVSYRPPVDAPVVEVFRPPATPYGPGNRGVDYATTEGQPVVASAAGEVVFAGPVGAALHVVVLHADGVRTSYSFLHAVAVRRGDRVAGGQAVGTAAGTGLHLGARVGDAYLDPLALFGSRPGRARLVADTDEAAPLSESGERASLVESLRHAGHRFGQASLEALAWLRARAGEEARRKADLARILASDAASLGLPLVAHLAAAALAWEAEQAGCTPATSTVPAPGGRRLAVLVGGLGSSSQRAAVFAVDTAALGYAPADVHRFSYREGGGPYEPADTQGDIGAAGARLAGSLDDLGRLHPRVPIDVIAHSQGGLVARAALLRHRPAGVATLVTLGTPHQGADLATAAAGLDATGQGHALLEGGGALPVAVDPNAPSVLQMAETSDFLRDLPEDGWPPGVRVVSVAARSDPVVPSIRSHLAGAANVVVDPPGLGLLDHARLPGSAAATREIALARAGLGPTCRSLADRLVDQALARQAATVADAVGAALAVTALGADGASLLRGGG